MADRKPYGPDRDRWLTAAETVEGVAAAVGLDRPADVVEAALGRGDDGGEIVLGALATDDATSNATPPTTAPPAAPTTTTAATPTTTVIGRRTAPSTTETPPTTSTTVPSTTTSTTPVDTAPPPFGVVTAADPLRVWIGGDSLGEYVGSRLLYKVADPELANVELDFHISTGLARPDYFDWPARLSGAMQREEQPPQVVVFMVGGNDDQTMRRDESRYDFGTPEWAEEYRRRVATMMDIAAVPGTQMLWIDLPPMASDRRNGMADVVNTILDEEAERRPWVSITSIRQLLSNAEGGYEQYLPSPDGDEPLKARAPDGVHITATASEWVSHLVWADIVARWEFVESDPSVGAASS